MYSRLPTDEALEKKDRMDEMKYIYKPIRPAPSASTARPRAPALPYVKVVGRPGTGNYPASSPDPTTHWKLKGRVWK